MLVGISISPSQRRSEPLARVARALPLYESGVLLLNQKGEMQKCTKCRRNRKSAEFGGKSKWCKKCRREYGQEHYQNNKQLYIERNRRRLARIREWMESLKNKPCVGCGNKFPTCVMEFDHVRGTKLFNLGDMFHKGLSRKSILEEIAKCDLVCANCHRIRTCGRSHTH